jgi:hypothetical protein
MAELRWYPLTGALTRAQIEENQKRGLMPPQGDVSLYADRRHFDVSAHGWRNDGGGTKLWAYNNPQWMNFHVAIDGVLPASDPATYSDPMWAIYGPAASRMADLYRQYPKYFDSFGWIPRMVLSVVDAGEARRMNVSDGVTAPYPLGVHMEGGLASFPAYVLKWSFNRSIVEAAEYQEFAAWAAATIVTPTAAPRPVPRLKVPADAFRAATIAAAFAVATPDEFAARVLAMVE